MDSTTAPVRPAPFQLFRNLAPPIEAALRASIYRFGVLVPVAKDQHGNILDGHQRARLADELGVKYPVNIIEVADDAEALEIARTLNEDRRAMPKEERLEVVKALREDEHSIRAIAGALGVSKSQVERDLAGVPHGTPDTARGLDGKFYPARKQPKLEPAAAIAQAKDVKRERRQERDLARERQRAAALAAAHPLDGKNWHVFAADISDVLGWWVNEEPTEADVYSCTQGVCHIITDPPYPSQYVPLYRTLDQLGAAVLPEGGSLLAMSGAANLEVVAASS